MTYYAVTDDPNELAHYGILGMKWGVRKENPRHSGSRRPRSAAYKKAQSKLGKMMKSGIKKAQANWRAYNSPEAKYERQTNRAMQQARRGKLKYGKLTDDQVMRITDRLALERQARQLSNTEQRFRTRLAKSIGEGVVSGFGTGVGRITSEFLSRGSVLKTDRLRSEQQDRLDRQKEKRRMRNAEKEAKKKAKRELEQEKLKDQYEHERDNQYARERAEEAYNYGLPMTSDGRIDYSDPTRLNDYYTRRYLSNETETRSDSYRRQQRESENHRREEERARRAEEQRHNQAARRTARATTSAIRNATRDDREYWNNRMNLVGRSAEDYINNHSGNSSDNITNTHPNNDDRRRRRSRSGRS